MTAQGADAAGDGDVLGERRRQEALPRPRRREPDDLQGLGPQLGRRRKGGKEDDLFSPYLEKPFAQARAAGVIPPGLKSIGGTWSTITDSGEATYLNMIHLTGYDGTDVWDLTRAEIEGRAQSMQAIKAMNHFAPGFEKAKLRTFGMTVGVRDTRKIEGRYNLTEHDVRNQARFDDSIGIFPEFIDGYGVLVLPTTGPLLRDPLRRRCLPQKVENLLVAGRCIAGDEISHAAVRSMMCCTVTGQGAGVAAAVSIKDGVEPARRSTSAGCRPSWCGKECESIDHA